MPADIARTVEDVRRLAPTAGFYWVRVRNGVWFVGQLDLIERPPDHSEGPPYRQWFTTDGLMDDETFVGGQIIGPLTPPSEEDTHG